MPQHIKGYEKKHANAPKNGEAFMSVFVFKTIRGAAPVTLPQKHLTWFKALINCLERDVQYKDHHVKHDIDQIMV